MKIHSYESLAALDGRGLRYGVFLSGCPLRCVYCHNPDTQRSLCAEERAPEELIKKIMRYKPYWKNGGGVTFSGGEPLLQAEEICRLGELLSAEGADYTLDTSGHVPLTKSVKQAILGASLVILDLKFPTDEDYLRYTGGGISPVLEILSFLCESKIPLWIRTVVVPGINDSESALLAYTELLRPYRDCIERYELLPFHTMGFHKYEQLGIDNPLKDTPAMDKKKLTELQHYVDKQLKI